MVDRRVLADMGPLPIDWDVKSVGDVFEVLDRMRKPLNKSQRERMRGPYPYYGANGVVDHISEWLFDEPLILMAEDGGYFDEFQTRSIAYMVDGKCWVNNHAHVLRAREGCDAKWFYYSLVHRDVRPFINSGTRSKLNQRDLIRIPVGVPPLSERRKIAAILSSVDDSIDKTQAVIDQVQVVKCGLMQELFTRGSPGQHTQFKQTEIGEIPREWDRSPLGRRVELQPGFAFKSRDFSADGDRLLRGSNVGVGRLIWADDKTKYFPSTRRAEVKDYELQEGDIVVAMDRPFISDGFKIATVTAGDLPALLLQRVGRFRRFRDLTPGYLWQLLQSGFVKTHLQISQKGTDLPHISKSEIESAICPFPTVDEQERIATRLEALDIYTTRLDQERKQCELLKAALMSVLLNGDLRVTPGTEAA